MDNWGKFPPQIKLLNMDNLGEFPPQIELLMDDLGINIKYANLWLRAQHPSNLLLILFDVNLRNFQCYFTDTFYEFYEYY